MVSIKISHFKSQRLLVTRNFTNGDGLVCRIMREAGGEGIQRMPPSRHPCSLREN